MLFHKIFLVSALTLLASQVFAGDLESLEAAKRKFGQSDRSEASRTTYVETLADLLSNEIAAHQAQGGRDREIEKIDAELKRLPAPLHSDSKKLAMLRVGKWRSPRHDYLYRADGTWTMLPQESDATHGRWHIDGNRYFDGVPGLETKSTYTIVLLNRKHFVFMDGQDVFYESRLSK